MRSPIKLECGSSFGQWVVVREAEPRYEGARKNKARYWICRCSCGKESEVRADRIIANRSKSCRSCAMKKANSQRVLPQEPTERVCRGCKKNLPLTDEFFTRAAKRERNPFSYKCRKCNASYLRPVNKKSRDKAKSTVIAAYGGVCACCGESKSNFLAIDHIGGGGLTDRKKNGSKMYPRLVRDGFPDGFRLLCHNCNSCIGRLGYCAHDPSDERFRHTVSKEKKKERPVDDSLDKVTTEKKTCFKCKSEFPKNKNYFYEHRGMADGLLGKCRRCSIQDSSNKSLANRRKLRQDILDAYGGENPKCSCCGEGHREFLELDHINGNGRQDRLGGEDTYAKVRRQDYPDGYRLLCSNCNMARGLYGSCCSQNR